MTGKVAGWLDEEHAATAAGFPNGPVLERNRPIDHQALRHHAERVRLKVIEQIDRAGLGHYSSTFSCAEILAALYYHTMRLCPTAPAWANRDRFLLGKGHAAVGLWPILADLGYLPAAWLKDFGQINAPLTDHPNMRTTPGVDFSAGSIGHNLSVGLGMALAGRLHDLDYRTFVLTGDGELQEGQLWEAAMAASHYRLGNLVAIVDANAFSGGGATSAAVNIEPIADRFGAFGWRTVEIDGHDMEEVCNAFDALPPPDSAMPTCIIARTVKGKGVDFMERAPQAWHIGILDDAQRDDAIAQITARMQP
jgi:transketolase